jgi:hypothetical protein
MRRDSVEKSWQRPPCGISLLFALSLLFYGCFFPACRAGQAGMENKKADGPARLRLLPEHPRYFEYKGLPMVLFGHQNGVGPVPVADRLSPEAIVGASRYANHYYMAVHSTWVRASYEEIYRRIEDETHWRRVRELAKTAYEHDVILTLFFWSYKYNVGRGDWSGSDMLWPDPSEDGGVVIESAGLTRRDLHKLAIERCLEATWDLPNVVYNFMWEYNVRRRGGQDPEGAFHRWWVEQLKETGARLDPDMDHLISIKLGAVHPARKGADFVVEEDGNGFWFGHSHRRVLEYNVPAVFISSDFAFADNDFQGWEKVPFEPRIWANGQNQGHPITPEDVRAMASEGFHPAETWAPAREDTLRYYLQARWYIENAGLLDTGLDEAMRAIPAYEPSERPRLTNPEGYRNGRNEESFGAVYAHPQGLPPALAEVWIDVNGDGRFSPDSAQGERFTMKPHGDDFRAGVLFTATGPANRGYVFRFADANWNPPVRGGLVSGQAEGISYDRWGR